MFMIRAAQLLPHTRFSDTEKRSATALAARTELAIPFPVVGGATLEVTLAQFWSSLGESSLEAEVAFYGIEAPETVLLDGGAGISKLYIRCLAPQARIQGELLVNNLGNWSRNPNQLFRASPSNARTWFPITAVLLRVAIQISGSTIRFCMTFLLQLQQSQRP